MSTWALGIWCDVLFFFYSFWHFINQMIDQWVDKITDRFIINKPWLHPLSLSHLLPFLCVFMCPLRLLFWLKHLPQIWQPYGFSPVWIRKCLSRWPARSKTLLQYEQTKHFFGLITWNDLLLLCWWWFSEASAMPCKPASLDSISVSNDP